MELDYPLDYHHGSPFLTNQDSMECGLTLEGSTHGWRVVDDLHNLTGRRPTWNDGIPKWLNSSAIFGLVNAT